MHGKDRFPYQRMGVIDFHSVDGGLSQQYVASLRRFRSAVSRNMKQPVRSQRGALEVPRVSGMMKTSPFVTVDSSVQYMFC